MIVLVACTPYNCALHCASRNRLCVRSVEFLNFSVNVIEVSVISMSIGYFKKWSDPLILLINNFLYKALVLKEYVVVAVIGCSMPRIL